MVSPTKGTTNPSKDRKNLKLKDEKDQKRLWTTRRTEILLECLEEAKAKLTGNVHGRNFTPKTKRITSAVKRHTGYDFSYTQVKNYWTRLKKTHGAFQRLCQQTGITCDVDEGRIFAEEHTWKDVLLPMNYTECKRIKEHGFPLFMRIDAIIGDARAIGTRAHPSCIFHSEIGSSADPKDIKRENVSGEDFIDVDSGKSGRKRKSADKVKNLMYEKGGSSGSKKNGDSFSTVQQSLDFRTSMLQQKGTGGGCEMDKKEKEMEKMMEAMQKALEAYLTLSQSANDLLSFDSDMDDYLEDVAIVLILAFVGAYAYYYLEDMDD